MPASKDTTTYASRRVSFPASSKAIPCSTVQAFAGRQRRELDRAELLGQRLRNGAPVQRLSGRCKTIEPVGQPVVQRILHGIPGLGPDAAVDLPVQFLELVAHFGLSPPGDLPTDP